MSTDLFEYVVWANMDNCIHRGPWSEQECIDWIESCREAFPEGARIDQIWSIRRRSVGKWEPV